MRRDKKLNKMSGLKRKGFTLVEIIIVVAIIALLVAVAMPNMLTAKMGANEAATRVTLRTFASASESYRTINFVYPADTSYLTGASPAYFPYDPQASSKDGYSYTVTWSPTGAGYTVTAAPSTPSITGRWEYRVTTGAVLEWREPSTGSWETF